MKNIFYLAGGLLAISGALHLAKVLAFPIDPGAIFSAVLTGLFGIAYLVIGVSLIRSRDWAVPWAVIVPGVGLLLSLLGGNRDTFSVAFMVTDLLVVGLCAYLLVAGQVKLGRVR